MTTFLIMLHIVVSMILILIVLLQTGKGADMGAAFGGSSQTVFGGAGPAPFLGKVTTAAAVIFMLTSLGLAYLSSNPFGGSIMKDVQPVSQSVPAIPSQDVMPGSGGEAGVQPIATIPAENAGSVEGAKSDASAQDNLPVAE